MLRALGRSIGRGLRGLFRFSVSSMLWLVVLSAIGTLWYLDHQQLQLQIDTANGRNSTAWSIDQVLGSPNTRTFGDISTAWAARVPDADVDWIIVEFPQAVLPASLEIYETYNPGAVVEVRSVNMNRSEQVEWAGKDPLTAVAGGRSVIPLASTSRLRRFKIVLDSDAVSGWNEIDAVGLRDTAGKLQWVSQAWASSSFGFNREPPDWYWP